MSQSNDTILVIDIGNTNIVFGVYKNGTLLNHWRLSTALNKTVDEYAILLNSLIHFEKIKLTDIKHAIISCVVPPLLFAFQKVCRKYIGIEPLVVEPGIKTGMPILYENPQEVGADRIVNAVAGYEKHKKALIIVDFGTATTFDYVTPRGEYVGGAIAPGIMISLEALFERASKLPRVELVEAKGDHREEYGQRHAGGHRLRLRQPRRRHRHADEGECQHESVRDSDGWPRQSRSFRNPSPSMRSTSFSPSRA